MKVFKFGGGVLVNAETITRLSEIISNQDPEEKIVVVVSAFAKNTNKLEEITESLFHDQNPNVKLKAFLDFHRNIAVGLGISDEVEEVLQEIKEQITTRHDEDFNRLYDQIVPYGELISTRMISLYLNQNKCLNTWLDAREIIRTDRNYRDAKVDFEITKKLLEQAVNRSDSRVFVIQGFIGSDGEGNSTTLGREGSDYSASIISALLGVGELIIWKDVKGVYNADPKVYPEAELINEMSYEDANMLTSFGAKVLHHKSIKPLSDNSIKLRVKYFFGPELPGTLVHRTDNKITDKSIVVTKRRQQLVYSSSQKLDFVEGLSHNYHLEINFGNYSGKGNYYCLGGNHELMNEFLSEILEFDGIHILDVTLLKIKNPNEEVINGLKGKYPVEFDFYESGIRYLMFT